MTKEEREQRRKALEKLNAEPIKKEVWLWIKLSSLGVVGIILILVLMPGVSDFLDKINPIYQLIIFLNILIVSFLWINLRAK
jgi:hypothetical protein